MERMPFEEPIEFEPKPEAKQVENRGKIDSVKLHEAIERAKYNALKDELKNAVGKATKKVS